MVSRTTLITGAAALVSAGSLAFAGSTLASADSATDAATPSASPTASSPTRGAQDGRGAIGAVGTVQLTGDEATKVIAAVAKKDSTIKVEAVRESLDGSFDVMGAKSGRPVMVHLSQDLATVEVRAGGGPGGRRGGRGMGGGHAHTRVTGDAATKVTDAVKRKDSGVTVESVMQDADGSYDVMGTKSGERVMVEVSKDLATVEVRTGTVGPGMGGMRGGDRGPDGMQQQGGTEEGAQPTPNVPGTTRSMGTSPTDVPVPVTQAA